VSANIPDASFIGDGQTGQSNSLLLPALDANVPAWIAEAMEQKKRHQPPFQCQIDIRFRISEPLKETSNATRHSAVMKALGPSRSYSRQPVITSRSR